jgi:hypothetical protein
VVVGKGSRGGRRPHEQGGVEAHPGEVVQPFYKLRHKGIRRGAGDFSGKKLPPLPVSAGVRGESLVELPLPGLGGVAELGWPGGSQVAGVDLGGGAPHLQVGDQLGRNRGVRLGRPGRRFSCGIAADLVGELGNKL